MAVRVAVVGAGAWGTALAGVAARAGCAVRLWARDRQQASDMAAARENARYLPGVGIPAGVTVDSDIGALGDADLVLLAVPAQALRSAAMTLQPVLRPGIPVVVCAKGVERGTGAWLSDVVAESLPAHVPAILSGPSFATDVAAGLPTAVTAAARDEDGAAFLATSLGSPTFRVYRTTDVRGVEIGGATKNVLAIASGIVAGRNLGASAHAALVARSFAELVRFGRAYGASPETLIGLSGLGDLVLTCNTAQSRNFSLGLRIGRGEDVAAAMGGKLAEGAFTAAVLIELAEARSVDMPIAAGVDAILAGRIGVEEAIDGLLRRPQKAEVPV